MHVNTYRRRKNNARRAIDRAIDALNEDALGDCLQHLVHAQDIIVILDEEPRPRQLQTKLPFPSGKGPGVRS